MREGEPGVQVEGLAIEWEHLWFTLRTGKKAEGQSANAGRLCDVMVGG